VADLLGVGCLSAGWVSAAEEASRREYQAMFPRLAWSSQIDQYEATKVGHQGLCWVAGEWVFWAFAGCWVLVRWLAG
jgi:hypothetical protein